MVALAPVLGAVAFTGAAALAIGTIAATVAPQWRRIARLAAGTVEAPAQVVR